jgi:hypothetical protein
LVYPSPLPCPFPPSMSYVSIIYALPFSTPHLLFLNLSFAFWTYIQYIYILDIIYIYIYIYIYNIQYMWMYNPNLRRSILEKMSCKKKKYWFNL